MPNMSYPIARREWEVRTHEIRESFMKAATSELGLQGWDRTSLSKDSRERTFQKDAAAQVKLEEHGAEVLKFRVHRVMWGACADSWIPTPNSDSVDLKWARNLKVWKALRWIWRRGWRTVTWEMLTRAVTYFTYTGNWAHLSPESAESVKGALSPRLQQTFRGKPSVLDPFVMVPAKSNTVLAASCSGRKEGHCGAEVTVTVPAIGPAVWWQIR